MSGSDSKPGSVDATPSAQVLVVDDETEHAEVMAESLRRLGHVCTLVHDLASAVDEVEHGQFDLVVTDLVMDVPDAGMKVLEAARRFQNDCEIVMVTAHGDVPRAKAAIRGGAYDFIEKPLDLKVFRTLCSHAIDAVMQRGRVEVGAEGAGRSEDETEATRGIIGTSPAIRKVLQAVRQVAASTIPVLITGESGTGKDVIARAIHDLSNRTAKRYVPLNCAAVNESLLEDELFGHVKGAFTDAAKDREGKFEYADGGTLFLDEIGDMPVAMQAKLLRVLESGEVVRVGSNDTRVVDVRLVSATNRDLRDRTAQGTFREDLYFRIKGVQIHLPALRERPEDIPLLVNHFAARFAEQLNRPAPAVSTEAATLMQSMPWRGNIRELMNVVQHAVISCEDGTIEVKHLPDDLVEGVGDGDQDVPATNSGTGPINLSDREKQAIRSALQSTGGNRAEAAKLLGIGERTLYRKLREYGLK